MSYPPGGPPPRWTPGWPPASPPAWPGWPGPDPIADLRERIARLEAAASFTADRLQAHSGRIQSVDERIQRMGTRVTQIEEATRGAAAKLAKLEDLPKRIEEQEARARMRKDLIQYGTGAVLLALALAGKVPMTDALSVLKKVLGLG